jgi:uncharacterized protein
MTHLMHDASAGMFTQLLKGLDAILDKAASHCEARKIEETVLTGERLFPDMLPFTKQVQLSCDFAVRAVFRLTGQEPPRFADEEKSFAELKLRIAKALAAINGVDAAAFEGSEARIVTFPMGPAGNQSFAGSAYLFSFAIPNFTFHVTTAYALLRENGVELGKRDFMGDFMSDPMGASIGASMGASMGDKKKG